MAALLFFCPAIKLGVAYIIIASSPMSNREQKLDPASQLSTNPVAQFLIAIYIPRKKNAKKGYSTCAGPYIKHIKAG